MYEKILEPVLCKKIDRFPMIFYPSTFTSKKSNIDALETSLASLWYFY